MLAANQAGHVIRLCKLRDIPTNVQLFGTNKTLLPFLVAPALAVIVLFLYRNPHFLREGLVLGWGVVIGEHVKSFFKRRLSFKEGTPWLFDRLDFAIGGGIAAWLYFPWVTWEHVLCIVAIAYPVHLIGNRFSYNMGWRKTPD